MPDKYNDKNRFDIYQFLLNGRFVYLHPVLVFYFKKIVAMKLPEDPMMLYSFINLKLRDFYPSLDALCEDMDVDKTDIIEKLKAVGFEYCPERNRFW